jgi:hypothetical protein
MAMLIENEKLTPQQIMKKMSLCRTFRKPVQNTGDLRTALEETSGIIHAPLIVRHEGKEYYFVEIQDNSFIRIGDDALFGGLIDQFFQTHPDLPRTLQVIKAG